MKRGLDRYTEMVWRPFFDDIFSFVSGRVVLDAGCGNARYTSQLVDFNEYHGADIEKTEYATEICSVEDMPYSDEKFDNVIALGLLDYSDPIRTLKEFNRVTKVGGSLDIMVPNSRNPYHIVSMVFGKKGKRRYTTEEISKLVESNGFCVQSCVVMGFSFFVPTKTLQELFIPIWVFLDKYLGSKYGMNIFIEAKKVEGV